MSDAAALEPADVATILAIDAPQEPPADVPSRWALGAADLRFFAICYLAGLILFLVMLS